MDKALDVLRNEHYINVETFKKDGNGVKTPVWFVELDGNLVFFSDGNSFKVKRVGRNPKARVAACDMRGGVTGSWFDATARLVEPGDLTKRAYELLGKKYGWQFALLTIGSKISGSFKRRQVVALQPA